MSELELRNAEIDSDIDAAMALRRRVFIEEQGVNQDIEQDGLDLENTTIHFVAIYNDQYVGAGRMLPSGKLGRICIAADHRGKGFGAQLLSYMVRWALDQNQYPCLYLHAQVSAKNLYDRGGFKTEGDEFLEAGIRHQKMVFDEQYSESLEAAYGCMVCRLEHPTSFQNHMLRMLGAGRRQLHILSHSLDSGLFDDAMADAISALARNHRQSQVNILLQDSRPLVGTRHSLIELSQRLPTSMSIRCLKEAPQRPDEGYFIVDRRHMVFFNNESNYQGFANYQAVPEAENRLEEFEQLWQHQSEEVPDFRRLSL